MAKLWEWSKEAKENFLKAAARGKGRFHVSAGLDAALATEMRGMVPAMAKLWIDLMMNPQQFNGRRVKFRITNPEAYKVEEGAVEVTIDITKRLLIDLMALNIPDVQPEEPAVETLDGCEQDHVPDPPAIEGDDVDPAS